MKTILSESNLGNHVRKYCTEIGEDPLLVQGAGGNASWKEKGALWIKASGTLLANAEKEDIFIAVDLPHLKGEIAKKDFSVVPRVIGDTKLRPSIETMLHALMPHRIVLHLHAVEVLAHLVRSDFNDFFDVSLRGCVSFAVVDYFKPGAKLAAEVDAVLAKHPSVNVIFLKNHGIVVGGESVEEVRQMLSKITRASITELTSKNAPFPAISKPPEEIFDQYSVVPDIEIQQLALNPMFFRRLRSDWALYPDHIVFLGPVAYAYSSWVEFVNECVSSGTFPELAFVFKEGVYARHSFTKAKQAQLRCYFDVIARQKIDTSLVALTRSQVAELLNWDAEQYRVSLAK